MSLTGKHVCCRAPGAAESPGPETAKTRRIFGSAISAIRLVIPGALFVFIPKCPLCIVAYVAAFTGLGLSVAAAQSIRILMMSACVGVFVYLLALFVRGFLLSGVSRRV